MDESPLEQAVNKQVPDFIKGQNPKEFYSKYYDGKSANYVRLADELLFVALLENGMVLPKKKLEGKDLLDIVEERCAKLTRGQLSRQHPSLYGKLRKFKILDSIPKREDIKEEINEKLLQKYHDNYEGITRGQLEKKDPALYQQLVRAKLIDKIPRSEQGQITRERKQNTTDPLKEYHDEYKGLTRGQLAQQNPRLYQRLRNSGLIEHVPKAEREFSKEESLEEYHSKYDGVTRTQLQRESPGLYHRLRKFGLLEHVPKGKRGRPRDIPLQCYSADLIERLQIENEQKVDEIVEDVSALQEYNDIYAGLTRTQLHKQDRALYERLRRAKLLERIPKKEDKEETDNLLLQEYHDKYEGLTRGELQKQDQAFYQRLRRAKLLEYVPRKDTGRRT